MAVIPRIMAVTIENRIHILHVNNASQAKAIQNGIGLLASKG